VREPYLAVVVLEELNLHSKQVNLMYFLKVIPDLMTRPEAVEFGIRSHELVLVLQGAVATELLEVKLDLAVVSVLHEDRVRVRDVLMHRYRVVFRAWMHVLWRFPISFRVHFETWCSECKQIRFPDASKRLYFDGRLNEVNSLPVVIPRGFLELIYEFLLRYDFHDAYRLFLDSPLHIVALRHQFDIRFVTENY